jgi:hypothetical protein
MRRHEKYGGLESCRDKKALAARLIPFIVMRVP